MKLISLFIIVSLLVAVHTQCVTYAAGGCDFRCSCCRSTGITNYDCQTCNANYYMWVMTPYRCENYCPPGEYINTSTTCDTCHAYCATCNASGFTNCRSCATNAFLFNSTTCYNLPTKTYVGTSYYNPCVDGFYAWPLTMTCRACPTGTTACSLALQYMMPASYQSSKTMTAGCTDDPDCLYAMKSYYCSSAAGYIWVQFFCQPINQCRQYAYYNSTSPTFVSSACVCLDNYYQFAPMACRRCHISCLKCSFNLSTYCTDCPYGFNKNSTSQCQSNGTTVQIENWGSTGTTELTAAMSGATYTATNSIFTTECGNSTRRYLWGCTQATCYRGTLRYNLPSGLGTDHYAVRIRFVAVFVDNWPSSGAIWVRQSSKDVFFYNYNSYGVIGQYLCLRNVLDVVQVIDGWWAHDDDNLDFTLYNNGQDIGDYYLGIRQLIIYKMMCHSSCLTCSGPTINDCLSCHTATEIVFNGTCEPTTGDCPNTPTTPGKCVCDTSKGYFYDGTSCVINCPNNATDFKDKASRECVTSCPQPLVFGDTSNVHRLCLIKCPTDYYKDNSSSPKICKNTCYQNGVANNLNYYKFNGTDPRCYNVCPQGYVGDQYLGACVEKCTDGYYNDSNYCYLTCPAGKYAYNVSNTCQTDCPNGYFQNNKTGTSQGICQYPCTSWSGTKLYGDNSTGDCVDSCPAGTYGDPYTDLCVKICNLSAGYYGQIVGTVGTCVTMCTANQTNTGLSFGNPITGLCVNASNCPLNYYADSYASGGSQNMCVQSCTNSLEFGVNSSRTCQTSCGVGFKYNITKVCVDICPTTPSLFGVQNGHCVSACTGNYYADAQANRTCRLNCSQTPAMSFGQNNVCVFRCQNLSLTNPTWGDPYSTTRACTVNCTFNSVNESYGYTPLNLCIKKCLDSWFGYVQANGIPICTQTCPLSLSYFGNNLTNKCTTHCPATYFGDPTGFRLCVQKCPDTYFAYQDANGLRTCELLCPTGYADNLTRVCVTDYVGCGNGTYGNDDDNKCQLPGLLCPNFADPTTQSCQLICPFSPTVRYFGDPSTYMCVLICPNFTSTASLGLFGDNHTKKCQETCSLTTEVRDFQNDRRCVEDWNCSRTPLALYADLVNKLCVDVKECPPATFADNHTNKCQTTCQGSVYLYADPQSRFCVIRCPDKYYAVNDTILDGICNTSCVAPLYADNQTDECTVLCTAGTYGVKYNQGVWWKGVCEQQCPQDQFARDGDNICVDDCGPGLFGNALLRKCVTTPQDCQDGYYANHDINLCVLPEDCQTVPSRYVADNSTWTCVEKCPQTTPRNYADLDKRLCVALCPSGKFGENDTLQCLDECLDYTTLIPKGSFADPQLRICVDICSTDPTPTFGQNDTYTCVQALDCPDGTWAEVEVYNRQCRPICPPPNTRNANVQKYSDDTTKKCVEVCPENYFGSTYTGVGVCVSLCQVDTLFADNATKTCVPTCSDTPVSTFGDQATRTCVSVCPIDFFAQTPSRYCVDVCRSGTWGDVLTRVCLQDNTACPIVNKIKQYADNHSHLCVSECPSTPDTWGENSTWYCVPTCLTGFKYIPTRVCIDICPLYLNGTGLFSDDGMCYADCQNGGYRDPQAWRSCVDECSQTPHQSYADDTTMNCVEVCPSYPQMYYAFDGNDTCNLDCPGSTHKNPLSQKCVDTCPDGTILDTNTDTCVQQCPYDLTNIWYANLVAAEPICVSASGCPDGYFADFQTRTCTQTCPTGQYKQNGSKLCVTFCPDGQYGSSSGYCVIPMGCPTDEYANNITKTCVSICNGSFAYTTDKICVFKCPAGLYADTYTRICADNCTNNATVQLYISIDNQTCQSHCDPPLFLNVLSNTCESGCPSSYFADPSTRTCVESCPASPELYGFEDDRICVEFCPTGTPQYYTNNQTRMCVTVCDTDYYRDPLSLSCVSACSDPYFIDKDLGDCVLNCSTKFALDVNNTCLVTCPSPYYNDPTTYKCVINCPVSPMHYSLVVGTSRTCTTGCPSGKWADPSSKSCVTQCPLSPLLFADNSTWKCVTTCPYSNSGTPYSTYALRTTRMCVNFCPGMFAENTTRSCVSVCPNGTDTYADGLLAVPACVKLCSSTTFADLVTLTCNSNCPSSPRTYKYENTTHRICVATCPYPTVSDNSTYSCVTSCLFDDLPYLDRSTWQCVAACPDIINYFGYLQTGTTNGGQCVNVCPDGYFSDNTTRTCVVKCPDGYYGETENNTCNTQCLVINGHFADPTNNLCVPVCKFNGTYDSYGDKYTRKCVTTCNVSDFTYADSQTRLCQKTCTNIPLVQYKDPTTMKCVTQCPNAPPTRYFSDPVTMTCVTQCSLQSKRYGYITDRTCQLVCPGGLFANDATRLCVVADDCQDGYFADDSTWTCVAICPTSQNTFGEPLNQVCALDCEAGYFRDPSTRLCVERCPEIPHLFADNGTSNCVASCPPNSYADNETRVCVSNCPSTPKQTFADNSTNLCVEICPTQPDYFSENNTWTCVDVCSSSYDMYADYSTRKCVYTCPSDGNNTFADNQTRLCVNRCPDAPIKTFNDNSTQRCKTSCTTGFADNITKFCVLQCPDYFYGQTITHTCVATCPITIPKLFAQDPSRMCVTGCNSTLGLFADNYTSRCVEVCPQENATFADNSSRSCVSQCPPNPLSYADSSTRTCVSTCPTMPALFGINGSRVCTAHCPDGSFADNSSRLCVAYCNTTNPKTYGDNSTWSCVAKCPTKPWFFADQSSHLCVDICPGDTYADNSTRKCVFPCDDPATFADITTKECVTTCPDGYFGNTLSHRCQTGCPTGYFADVLLHLCVQKCSVDPIYYGNPLTNWCVDQCPLSSASFGNPLTQQCVTFNSSGYSGCPQFHFADNSTRLCVPVCPMKEDTYSDNFTRKCVSTCPNSTKDTYSDNSTMRCVDRCPTMPDYYAQVNSRRCVKNCLAPTLTFSGTFADNSTRRCVSRCPSEPDYDYYSDNSTVRCVMHCPVNPLTFADNSTRRCVTTCPSTPQDLYGDLKTRRCVLNCPVDEYTYADNTTRRCQRVCNHTALLFGNNRTRRCVRDCQNGTYADNSSRLCVEVCPDYQDTYGDPTSNTCVSLCPVGYFADPFSQTCMQQCPFLTTPIVVKTYGDLFTRRCVADCPRNRYTYADDLTHSCTDPCPVSQGTYGDDTTKKCVTQCPDVPFLYAENITRRCAAICPNMTGGGFAQNISRMCVTKCPDLTYGDPISLYCKFYCQQDWWGEDINNTCVQTCPDGTYADNTTRKCVDVCPVSHLLFGVPLTKTCDPACPDGTYADSFTQVCQVGCPASQDTYAFDGNNTCVKECPFPLLAYNVTRVCLGVCPDPYYPNIQDHRCYRCPLECAICLYTQACTKCVSGFYLYDGQCLQSCPIVPVVTYANVNGTCGNSLQCSAGYFALNATKTCVTNCPSGYYKNTILQTCQYCMKGCINCTVYSICLQCNSLTALWDNYTCYPFCSRLKRFYYGSGCTANCPAGTFLNLTFCTVCDPMCKTCQIQPSNCLTCADGLYLQNHLCVSTCPNNSRPVFQNNSLICKICGEDGLDCTTKTKLNYTVNQTIENFKYKLYLAFNQPVNITGNLKNIFQIVQVAARRLLTTSTVNYTIIDYGNGVFGFLIDGFDASLVDGFRFQLQFLDPTAIKGAQSGDIPQQTRIQIIVPQDNFYIATDSDKHFANYAALVTWVSLLLLVGLCWAKAQTWIPMFDILQFLFLMYFVNVVWPPGLTYMLAALESSFFNFMPNMFSSVLPKPVPSANLNGQIYYLLGDATFLRSAGYLLTITLVLLIFVGLMVLLTKNKSIIKDNNSRLKLKKIWRQSILNRCIHSLAYIFFLPTVFYALLQMLDYNVVYPVTGFSIFCSLVYFLVMLVVVAWLLYKTIVFWKKYPRTMEALARAYELISRYPVATMETDENKFQLDGNQIDLRSLSEPRINGKLILPMQIETYFSKSALATPFVSYGFKLLNAIFIVACFKNPLAQLLLNLALTIILLGYNIKVQPYIYKRGKYMVRNWLTYANITMMILIQLTLIIFQIKYTQLEKPDRVIIGDVACYLITFTITYNIIWLIYRFYDEWHHRVWRPFVYSECFKDNFPIEHFAYVQQYEKEKEEENKSHKKTRKKLRKEVEQLDKVHAKLEVKLQDQDQKKIRTTNMDLRPTQKQILQKDIENFMVEVYERDRSQSNKTSSSLSKKQRREMVQQIFTQSRMERHQKQEDFVVMPVPVRPKRQPTQQVAVQVQAPQERTEPMDEYSYEEYEEEYPEDADIREILAGSNFKGNVVLP